MSIHLHPGPGRPAPAPPAAAAVPPDTAPAPVVPAMRRLLGLAAVLVFLAGVQLYVFPLRTDRYFAWTIDSPMTATFLGASYWSAVALELGAARARQWAGARVAVPAVTVFTTVTLGVTIAHLDRFHLDGGLSVATRAVTWAWIGVYVAVPVLMAAAALAQRRRSTAVGPSSGLPRAVRAVLTLLAAALLGLGAALLIAPTWADGAWPWALTPLTARAVGAWLVGLGTAAAHARLLDDVASLRPLAWTGVTFGVLQAVALARHGDELDWASVPAATYVVTVALLAGVSAWALRHERPGRPTRAPRPYAPAAARPVPEELPPAGSSRG